MELLEKKVKGWETLIIWVKSSIIGPWQGPEYTSEDTEIESIEVTLVSLLLTMRTFTK